MTDLRTMPAPINRRDLQVSAASNNGSRPRRFSTDPARHDSYAVRRQARLARRLGFR